MKIQITATATIEYPDSHVPELLQNQQTQWEHLCLAVESEIPVVEIKAERVKTEGKE